MDYIRDSKSRKTANKHQFAINDILTESKERLADERDYLLETAKMKMDLSLDEQNQILNEEASLIKENKMNKNTIADLFLVEAFAAVVEEAVPLNSLLKEELKDEIYDSCKYTILKVRDENLLLEGNSSWNAYLGRFMGHLAYCIDEPSLATHCKEIECDDKVECLKSEMASVIKDKVANVIKNERYISENKVQLIQENKNFKGDTFFNAMLNYGFNALSEDAKFMNESDEVKVNNLTVKSTITYTILESLNTLKLMNISPEVINRVTKKLYV